MVWLKEKSGEYSTKTGYGLGMVVDRPTLVANEPVHWLKDIWNVNTSPKLKDFIWRVVKKAIPVSSNLERRGVPRFNCKKCGGYEDDMHVFLSCSIAEEVWSLIPITQGPGSSISSVPELIKQGKQYVPLPPTAQETVLKSITDAKEWNDAQPGGKSHPQDNPSPARPHCNSTVPPPSLPATILVCKVDAAWDASSGGCGIGGIFCGSNDRNLSNISEAYSHVSSALMAEAIVVHRAVALAVYLNVRSLAVLSDSLSLIKLLKRGGTQPELFDIMFDIYHFIKYFDVISFDFISRNFNAEADTVAKSALALSVMNSNIGV
ncbi:hypothetical protein Bca4012_097863 [Brassica carinata]